MKEKPIVVAVGSPDDLRSSVWRLWVHGDDVYFGPRIMSGTFKVSLHKSGDWRIAWVRSLKRGGSDDRVVMKWRGPDEFTPGFVNGVMALVSPFAPKDPFRNKAVLDSAIEWLDLPQDGKLLALIVLIATPEADFGRLVGSKIVGRIKKENGEEVLLIANEMDLTDAIKDRMIEEKSKVKIHVEKSQIGKLIPSDKSRMIFSMAGASGEMPAIYDVPLDWENVVPNSP